FNRGFRFLESGKWLCFSVILQNQKPWLFKSSLNMLKSKFSFLFVFILYFMGSLQAQDITGLWKGWLYNDSTGLTQKYEIAISEEKGKLFGYSHTWFILEDKQYYGVKKVSIRKSDGKILIVDDGLI